MHVFIDDEHEGLEFELYCNVDLQIRGYDEFDNVAEPVYGKIILVEGGFTADETAEIEQYISDCESEIEERFFQKYLQLI